MSSRKNHPRRSTPRHARLSLTMKFKYIATQKNGQKIKGSIQANNKALATEALQNKGLLVISVDPEQKFSKYFSHRSGLSLKDRLLFTKYMASMIKAGIPLTEAITILTEQSQKSGERNMYEEIGKRVQSGQTLSESLEQYPKAFSPIFVSMIRVGEKSGTLEEILAQLEIQLKKDYELRKKVVSALIYPAVIVGITLLLAGGIVFFIMPKVVGIFDSFDVKLPLPTRVLIGVTKFSTEKPFLTLLAIILSIGLSLFIFQNPYLKPMWQKLSLKIPVFGRILKNVNLARFTRSLHSLLKSGVPINRALKVSATLFTNPSYKGLIEEAQARVEKGSSLEEALQGHPKLVPNMTLKMINVGERSGNLELATQNLAEMYEQNVDAATHNLSTLMEPILLVFMGGLVGGVALAVILPIYQLPNLL